MERKFKKARWPCDEPPRPRKKAEKREGRWTKSSYYDPRRVGHSKEEWLVDKIMRFEDWAWEKKMKRAEKKNRVGEVLFMANIEKIYLWWRYGQPLTSSSSEEDTPEEIVLRMENEMFGRSAPPPVLEMSWEVDSASSDYDSIPEYSKPSASYGPEFAAEAAETPWSIEPKRDSPYWTIKKRRKMSI